MGGFSKVTNFLKDVLMQPEVDNLPTSKVEEILNEDIPGMEINNQDEPGYELVSKVREINFHCSLSIYFYFFTLECFEKRGSVPQKKAIPIKKKK